MKSLQLRSHVGAFIAFGVLTSALVAADLTGDNLNLTANATVGGNATITGTLEAKGNSFALATQGTGLGSWWSYDNTTSTDTLINLLVRDSASWLWAHTTNLPVANTLLPAMRLTSAHDLLLYQANGTTAGVTLQPSSNAVKLGDTATLSGNSSGVLATSGPLRLGTTATLTGDSSGAITTSGGLSVTGTLSAPGATVIGGLNIYNTADQTTNYERFIARWTSNQTEVGNEYAGAGNSGRPLFLGVGSAAGGSPLNGRWLRIINQIGTNPVFTFNASTGVANLTEIGVVGTFNQTSGTNVLLSITPTYSQTSSTAANTDFLINRTETALGSGAQRFLDFQVAGTSKFRVDRLGALSAAGALTVSNTAASTSTTTGAIVTAGGLGVGGSGYFGSSLNTAGVVQSSGTGASYFAGNVGLGTTSPSTHLHVHGAGDQEISISSSDSGGRRWTMQSDGAGTSNNGKFEIIDRTVTASRLAIDTNGNIGVGTVTPSAKLEVVGDLIATTVAERKTSFVPTTAGWWRIAQSGGEFAAGTVRIYAPNQIGGGYVEHELQFSMPGYGMGGSLFQSRGPTYTAGQEPIITSARVSSSGSWVYLDVYVRTTSTETITIYGFGPRMPSLSTPTANAVAGSTPVQISLSSGVSANSIRLNEKATAGQTFGQLVFSNWDSNSYQNAVQIRGVALSNPSGGYAPSGMAFYTGYNSGPSERMRITDTGNVGIGTTSPTYLLSVAGTIRAKEIIVDTGWADYVFDENYRLAPLSEVEAHIKAEKHLPGIPSAQEVETHGVSMGDMQAKLLSKVEELTLHLIAQEKEIAALKQHNAHLEQSIADLRAANSR